MLPSSFWVTKHKLLQNQQVKNHHLQWLIANVYIAKWLQDIETRAKVLHTAGGYYGYYYIGIVLLFVVKFKKKVKYVSQTCLIKEPRHWNDAAPVFSCFVLKHSIAVLYLFPGLSIDSDIWILLCCLEESVEDPSLPILPHVPIGTPEDIRSVCRSLEIKLFVFQQEGDAGVRHHSDGGAAPDIFLVPRCGCVVHPDHAFSLVYLFTEACAQHLTWAGDQGTVAAAHVQVLIGDKKAQKEVF